MMAPSVGLDNGGGLHWDLIEEWGERGSKRCEYGCSLRLYQDETPLPNRDPACFVAGIDGEVRVLG
jgi:hypothetical protein